MSITEIVSSDGVVLRFSGVLDYTMDRIFRATVERVYQLSPPHMIFDFTYLTDVDHVGLGLLLMTLFGLHILLT